MASHLGNMYKDLNILYYKEMFTYGMLYIDYWEHSSFSHTVDISIMCLVVSENRRCTFLALIPSFPGNVQRLYFQHCVVCHCHM
jgi:hypothetical protein